MKEVRVVNIRPVDVTDVSAIVDLSDDKRRSYEKIQPLFWKRSEHANGHQAEWFCELINRDDHILLLAENTSVVGFIIGRLIEAPAVYAPGGLTLVIDDFCVEHPTLWVTVGLALLGQLKQKAHEKGVVQVVVACGDHDDEKIAFLERVGLSVATRWYVGGINDQRT